MPDSVLNRLFYKIFANERITAHGKQRNSVRLPEFEHLTFKKDGHTLSQQLQKAKADREAAVELTVAELNVLCTELKFSHIRKLLGDPSTSFIPEALFFAELLALLPQKFALSPLAQLAPIYCSEEPEEEGEDSEYSVAITPSESNARKDRVNIAKELPTVVFSLPQIGLVRRALNLLVNFNEHRALLAHTDRILRNIEPGTTPAYTLSYSDLETLGL